MSGPRAGLARQSRDPSGTATLPRLASGTRARFVLAAALTALLLALPAAASAQQRCFGKRVTIKGSPSADVLRGTGGADVIGGGGGPDRIVSGGGRDLICAGGGADTVASGPGDDRMDGGSKADFIDPGDGEDEVKGGGGGDEFPASPGDDRTFGGAGIDVADYSASAGPVVANLSFDFSFGPDGEDLMDRVESVIGSDGDDTLVGDQGRNALLGGPGGDGLAGGPGDDVLAGFQGTDFVDGGDGSDRCSGEFRAACERGFPFPVPERREAQAAESPGTSERPSSRLRTFALASPVKPLAR